MYMGALEVYMWMRFPVWWWRELRPLAFYSKNLGDTDKVWSIYEIKFISLVKTITRFRHFLGSEFDIYTDNWALSWILNKPKRLLKYGELVEQLSQFNFKILQVRTIDNVVADFMFRMYNPYEFKVIYSKLGKKINQQKLDFG